MPSGPADRRSRTRGAGPGSSASAAAGRAVRPRVVADPRDDAADQRDEQQQIDRREPGRGVDLEQPDPVVERAQPRVLGEEVVDLHRSDRRCGSSEPGYRGQRQREEQHQGGAHRGQLGPQVAQPTPPAEGGRSSRRLARRGSRPSDHRLERGGPLPQRAGHPVPGPGDQQQPDPDQQHPADPHHQHWCRRSTSTAGPSG